MKKLFIILLTTLFGISSAWARPNHSLHHEDWIGVGIVGGLISLTAAIVSEPSLPQPQPVIVSTSSPIVVQQPIIVQQPIVQMPVVHSAPRPAIIVHPLPPPPPPPRFFRPVHPPPPPPTRRHHPGRRRR